MFLIDTHILLWALYDSEKLSENAMVALNSERCCVSIASLWEISIKQSLGKLQLRQSIEQIAEQCDKYGIPIIGIEPRHCQKQLELPFIHKDPFDRIIIAQAVTEGYTIITADEFIQQYDVKTLW